MSDRAHGQAVDANQLLVKAGFLQQPYSGIFHLLPLGVRVQEKLEKLIEKHMRSVNAAKVSLSSISSAELWQSSGRLETSSELFRFNDRKGTDLLLSPTHEEEITALASSLVHSYRDLPLRMYQISRKYRDELRPRHGLLRAREFLMKDLYTFDAHADQALATYEEVKAAYTRFFDELKVPYLVANAGSGNMGGSLSHEFHFPNDKGEDSVLKCTRCQYTRNEELVDHIQYESTSIDLADYEIDLDGPARVEDTIKYIGVSKDRTAVVKAYAPVRRPAHSFDPAEINPYAVKAAVPEIDLGLEDPGAEYARMNSVIGQGKGKSGLPIVAYLFDSRVTSTTRDFLLAQEQDACVRNAAEVYLLHGAGEADHVYLHRVLPEDQCPECHEGELERYKAIEVGHTFHLGTRYTDALDAMVTRADNEREPLEMGCHGIGISRLISAVALSLADEKGLNWPRVIAPYQVVIIPPAEEKDIDHVEGLFDNLTLTKSPFERNSQDSATALPIDPCIDNRDKSLAWKLHDADRIGFPVIVLFGRKWAQERKLEVQCRQKKVFDEDSQTYRGLREDVHFDRVPDFVKSLLDEL